MKTMGNRYTVNILSLVCVTAPFLLKVGPIEEDVGPTASGVLGQGIDQRNGLY